MKPIRNILAALAVVIAIPLAVSAFNNQDVTYTVHNLSTDAGPELQRNFFSSSVDQICIYCHTPHNSKPGKALWNKSIDPAANTGSYYRLYTSSKTLTTTVKVNSSLTPNSESVLCLSCHDGKSAVNVVHSVNSGHQAEWLMQTTNIYGTNDWALDVGGLDTPQAFGDLFGAGFQHPSNIGATRNADGSMADAKAGFNLTDDHPVGFSYVNAYNENTNKLHTKATPEGQGLRFYGPARDRLECSTCHDPHVFYGYGRSGGSAVGPITGATAAQIEKRPFLRMSNKGSAMCLACHQK